MLSGLQLGQHGLVPLHALHLEKRAFVIVQAQPAHAFDDHINSGLARALHIRVFNPQDEVAASGTGKSPWIKRRTNIAQVDKAGRRRGKAGTDFSCHVIFKPAFAGRAADRP